MPWTGLRYPRSMSNLPERVRRKAIANASLEDGYDEARSIRSGMARAKHSPGGRNSRRAVHRRRRQ